MRLKEAKSSGIFLVTVRAESLRGPSGFLDTRFEQPPVTIQSDCVASWWLQAHPESRHEESQSLGFAARLT